MINESIDFYENESKPVDQVVNQEVDKVDEEAQVVSEPNQPDADPTDGNAVQDPQDSKPASKGPKIDDNVELKICDLGNG